MLTNQKIQSWRNHHTHTHISITLQIIINEYCDDTTHTPQREQKINAYLRPFYLIFTLLFLHQRHYPTPFLLHPSSTYTHIMFKFFFFVFTTFIFI